MSVQDYEDDFFFEEDKINIMAYWPMTPYHFNYVYDPEYFSNKLPDEDRNIRNETDKNFELLTTSDKNLMCPVEVEWNLQSVSSPNSSEVKTKSSEDKTDDGDNSDCNNKPDDGDADYLLSELCHERFIIANQNLMGMTITSGYVIIVKDESNLIGISIGGGAPLCPCLYIVQVFDNTPASREGTLQSGDEIVGVNGQSVKGKTKVEVAKMIQSAKDEVNINYNKLHADPRQGKCLDIILKKMKHRLVENMSTSTADALGLSRAILCNDTLVKKLKELQNTEQMYHGLVEHAKRMLKAYFDVLQIYKTFGDAFASIGVREPQPRASEAFSKFGNFHRQMEKDGIKMLKALKPILSDMGTYLHKAIPDTKLTIKKYADTKFEYLSYCLKVKEMDDEEYSYGALQEPLYRVETGNYEYRLVLRCRQDARNRFARLRSDVLVKMELLDNKHVQDVVWQLQRFILGLATFHNETLEILKANGKLFPVEVDLTQNAFQYKSASGILQETEDDDNSSIHEIGKEIKEFYDVNALKECLNGLTDQSDATETDNLLPSFENTKDLCDNITENTSLLAELGLDDTSQITHSPFGISNLNKTLSDTFFNVDLLGFSSQKVAHDDDFVFGDFVNASGSSTDLLQRNDSKSNLLSSID